MSDAVSGQMHNTAGRLDRLADAAMAFGTGVYASFSARIGAVLFALYVALVAATVVVIPHANWDMLAYLAVAEEGSHPDAAALHAHVYATVKAGVSEGEYAALTTGDPFRVHMAADPAAFQSMLPMYRVKFLYAELLSSLSGVMSPVAAIRAVSLFSTLLFGLVTLLWLRSQRVLPLAPALGAVLIVAGFADAARAGTPDMLSSALMLAGLYAYSRRQEAPTAVLLFLAFMVRPDNLAFLGVFAVLLALFRQWSWGALAAFAAAFAAYVPISHWAGHPGWWPHLYFSSIQQQLDMTGFDPAFSAALYAKAFAIAVVRAVTMNSWVGVAALAVAGWYAVDRAGFKLDRRAGVLFAALILGMAAKFVVFPIHDTRIYFPNLIPPFLLLAVPLAALFSARATASEQGNASTVGDLAP